MFFGSKNTTEKGHVRCIIFREGDTWYGIGLEFNIVVSADSKMNAFVELDSAMKDYVDTTRIHRIRNSVLNQDAASEYSQLWKDLNSGKTPQLKSLDEETDRKHSLLEVGFYGYLPQPA